jgi:cohesin loading factor subunit SCC2
MRSNLVKNILPAINQTGHIIPVMTKSELIASPPSKKRRRSSGIGGNDDKSIIRDMKKTYNLILRTVGPTVLLMERLDVLIQRIDLDDQHLMICSAGALNSLELEYSKASHQIHEATLGIITSIFRRNPKLRPLIIEDLFGLMLKMPTGKKNMRTFPVQCSSVLYPERAFKLARSLVMDEPNFTYSCIYVQPVVVLILSLVQSSVVRPDDATQDSSNSTADQQQRRRTGLQACQSTSDLFVRHLMLRCSKKGEDGGASEFRPILSNIIDDLLVILLIPEYPAAEMILLSIVNAIFRDVQQITEGKNVKELAETTYLNTIFDALGKICSAEARIRMWNKKNPVLDLPTVKAENPRYLQCYCEDNDFEEERYCLNCDRCNTWYHGDCVGISRNSEPENWLCDGCQLGRIVDFEKDHNANRGELGCAPESIDRTYCMRRLVVDYLSYLLHHSGQPGVEDAYKFHLARWLSDLEHSNTKSLEKEQENERNYTTVNNSSVMSGILDLWDPKDAIHFYVGAGDGTLSGMLQCLSDEGRSRIVVELICRLSGLLTYFQSQVRFIVDLLGSGGKSIRKLSLKAIEKIADADPSLMVYPFIRNAVIRRFSDESISVREAVVSLVGCYVVQAPDVANKYHLAFMEGLNDSGVSVRKRTINVLQEILCSNPSYDGRAEACSVMLRLAADPKEDYSVRDMIHDLFSKMWLQNGRETIVKAQEASPTSSKNGVGESPASRVYDVENVGMVTATPSKVATPNAAEDVSLLPNTPPMWSTATKSTRSTAKKRRSRHMRIRCEVAAEQMVEVVKASNTADHLTILFRELLSDIPDSDKSRRSSARKKRQGIAKEQSAMLIDALVDMLLAVEDSAVGKASGANGTKRTLDEGKDFVAIFRVILVFTNVSPDGVLLHIDTFLPYLKADNGFQAQHEEEIASSLCQVLSRIVPELDQDYISKLSQESLAGDLANIIKKWGRSAVSSAVRVLCLLAQHKHQDDVQIFRDELLSLARCFYAHLTKHIGSDAATMKWKVKANVQRGLGVLGSICRYFESSSFDLMETDELADVGETDIELTLGNLTPLCEKLFMIFFRKDDVAIKCAALRALSGIFLAHPREMLRMDQSGLIKHVMGPDSPIPVQLESLRRWREILLAEENRIESGEAKAKMDAKKDITLSKKISGDQDADATLFGSILTNHSTRLYEMTECRDIETRFAAVDLMGHLLRQGQLNPNDATPHLLAVQGDVEETIRCKALKLLMLEAERRPDMVRQRVYAGVKQAYQFQKAVYPELEDVSALIDVKNEKECVFGSVYKECIASNKKQRRGLFRNLLVAFDPENVNQKKNPGGFGSSMDLELLSFTSQVLAYLPYGFPSDPLFIIHYITTTIALHGNDLLDRFADFFRPYGLASEDELDDVNVEEDDIEKAARRRLPHHAKEVTPLLSSSFEVVKFADLCKEAGCLILLLRLKSFLQKSYNLSEARCQGFNPEAKDTVEKPIAKYSISSVFHSKLPMHGMTKDDGNDFLDAMIFQYAEFRRLMREEVHHSSTTIEYSDEEEEEGGLEPMSVSTSKRRRSST